MTSGELAALEALGENLTDEERWEAFRQQFFQGERINLNPGTLGTCSRHVFTCVERFYEDDLNSYPLGQYQRGREAIQKARTLAIEAWPGAPGEPAICAGATQTMNLLTLALHPVLGSTSGSGQPVKVLTSLHEHYGGVAGFERHPGYRVKYFKDSETFDPEAFQRRVVLEQPEIVFLSQVAWTDGRQLPVGVLSEVLKSSVPQCWMITDAAQALGVLPPDWGAADVLIASGHKWLFGPGGTGFLWLSTRASEGLGALHWSGEPLDPDASMSRFEPAGGQDFSAYAGLAGALELFLAVSPEVVRLRSQMLAEWFMERLCSRLSAAGIGFRLTDPVTGRASPGPPQGGSPGGMLSLSLENLDAYPLYAFLNHRQIHVKCIKGFLKDGASLNLLRIGFPYYESLTRLGRVLDCIEEYFQLSYGGMVDGRWSNG